MDANEEMVRTAWDKVWREDKGNMREQPCQWHGYILIDTGDSEKMIASGTRAVAWAAAAEFTRERILKIHEVEEEIGWMEADVDRCTERGSSESVPYRTLMRLEGIRNDLLRGMKAGK
jgi:hypothetical protein